MFPFQYVEVLFPVQVFNYFLVNILSLKTKENQNLVKNLKLKLVKITKRENEIDIIQKLKNVDYKLKLDVFEGKSKLVTASQLVCY